MNLVRVGRSARALRIRIGVRQEDVAARAGVSRSFVSKLESGALLHADVDKLDRISKALGAELDVRLRWHGEAFDRLLDEAHAALVDRVVRILQPFGWVVGVEVSFNEFGDRGSVDVLGWHAATSALLIVEVKSIIVDAQGTLFPLDRKTRLGAKIGALRGWQSRTISRLLIVEEGSTNRDRVSRLEATFRSALPARGTAVRHWLQAPSGSISGLLFLRNSTGKGATRGRAGQLRVRRVRSRADRP